MKRKGRINPKRMTTAAVLGLAVVAVLLSLGMTSFRFMGYITEDSFAVPEGALTELLAAGEQGTLALADLKMGDEIYKRDINSRGYYIGETKRGISDGYPLYTRSGQVLYFMDDRLLLVTDEWETLSTYEGLHLSNGVTFNADQSQADIETVILAQVEGGYAVAQPAVTTVEQMETHIPMNAVCAFEPEEIIYYSYNTGALRGASTSMPLGSTITIGDQTWLYRDFLEKLNLWEEEAETWTPEHPEPEEPEEPAPPEETPSPTSNRSAAPAPAPDNTETVTGGEILPKDAEPEESEYDDDWDFASSDDSDDWSEDFFESDPADLRAEGEAEHRESTKKPSDVLQRPQSARSSASETPVSPPPVAPVVPVNPGYVEPTVSFSEEIGDWIYTLTVNATVEDPANVLRAGVQLWVYRMNGNEEEFFMRRTISTSGSYDIGQLKPDETYRIYAEYSYRDRLNYLQKKSIYIGEGSTQPFSDALIRLSARDEYGVYTTEADKVQYFSNSIQLRDVVFDNLKSRNGTVVEPDGVASGATEFPRDAETYITTLQIRMTPESGGVSTNIRMDSSALQLLRAGYQLRHWETEKALSSNRAYSFYEIRMTDRWDNAFTVEVRDSNDSLVTQSNPLRGHTCNDTPRVLIDIPDATNLESSTQINVGWYNPGSAPVGPDTHADAPMGNTTTAALFFVPEGMEVTPANAVAVDARQPGSGGASVTGQRFLTVGAGSTSAVFSTSWIVTSLTPMRSYTAAVAVGYFDINDGTAGHYSEIIDDRMTFVTASIARLGTIPYAWQVDQLGYSTARLGLRLAHNQNERYFFEQLLNLVTDVELTLGHNGREWKLGLNREQLEAVLVSASGATTDATSNLKSVTATFPVYLDDEEIPHQVTSQLLFTDGKWPSCTYQDEDGNTVTEQADNVWEFLLWSSHEAADTRVTLPLGTELPLTSEELSPSRLVDLEPRTVYEGPVHIYAKQGEMTRIDVTNAAVSANVSFRTVSEDAAVYFNNYFYSANFIELYDLNIEDVDECILPDVAGYGGNVRLEVRRVDPVTGYETYYANYYLQSDKSGNSTQADYPVYRIPGLEKDVTYSLRFNAMLYKNGDITYEDYYLKIGSLPENADDNTRFVFTTGASVTGEVSLNGIDQYYRKKNPDGSTYLTTQPGLLDPEKDFYDGVWQDTYFYYSGGTFQELFIDKVDEKETDLSDAMKEKLKMVRTDETDNAGINARARDINASVTTFPTVDQRAGWARNAWMTRMIAVTPGDLYSLFNSNDNEHLRISFFYLDAAGKIQKNSVYNASQKNYIYGGLFQVPSRAVSTGQTNVCYMRISGYTPRGRDGMILEKYDPTNLGTVNMVDAETISRGYYLSESNAITRSNIDGFHAGYIPVTGNSIYMLAGRDESIGKDAGRLGTSTSTRIVLFYNSSYNYIGRYTVGAQTALVKAPHGAAYCRFNVAANYLNGVSVYDATKLEMRSYRLAEQDSYLATIRAELSDPSEPVGQIMRGGSYTLTMYQTTTTVTDATVLENLTEESWEVMADKTVTVPVSLPADAKLAITDDRSFDDLLPGRGFRVHLTVRPGGWNEGSEGVLLSTTYFTTNRAVRTISNLSELYGVLNDPAGSYVVIADIEGVNAVLSSEARPFSGTIDFQGHTIKKTGNNTDPLFARITSTGVVRNLKMVYEPQTNAATASNMGAVVNYNYGTLQNIVLNYGPNVNRTNSYSYFKRQSGGIAAYNYGSIDGFVVNLTRDVLARDYFGAVCYQNYGTVSNGYVTGEWNSAENRRNAIIHIHQEWSYSTVYESFTPVTTANGDQLSYGVAYNAPSGTVENMFVVTTGLYFQSTDPQNDYDLGFGSDNSVTGTAGSGLALGSNNGHVYNVFTVGDRYDVAADMLSADTPAQAHHAPGQLTSARAMTTRGPAVPWLNTLFHGENIVYFSDYEYKKGSELTGISGFSATARKNAGDKNQHGEWSSLRDFKWYETMLGTDGSRFKIRENLENGVGYYPSLILPECFPSDAQPQLPLPAQASDMMTVLDNEVRAFGKDPGSGRQEALVTITLDNPNQLEITGFEIYDEFGSTTRMNAEVLSQRALANTWRVDILLSLGADNKAGSTYEIRRVYVKDRADPYTAYSRRMDDSDWRTDVRFIQVEFWDEIASREEWKTKVVGDDKGYNYRLTADLDFAESVTYEDWYRSADFTGKLDGGIYRWTPTTLTSDAGEELTTSSGAKRQMLVQGELLGMHTISNFGNVGLDGAVASGRRNSNTTNRVTLMRNLSGATVKNLVFDHFINQLGYTLSNGRDSMGYVTNGGVFLLSSNYARLENCHLRNSVVRARTRLGGLVSESTDTVFENCSVRNCEIVSYRYRDDDGTMRIGGISGSCTRDTFINCFTADTDIIVASAYESEGIGGVGGYCDTSLFYNCYSTGSIDAATRFCGGIAGRIRTATSELTGCWSAMAINLTGDYAGGIVGYYEDGLMHNNYAMNTIITRALAAGYVHRVASNTTYDQTKRYDNYAYEGQYLTYTDPAPASGTSPYRFGTWDDFDGATRLLSDLEARNADIWRNEIGIDADAFDLTGRASVRGEAPGSGVAYSGGTRISALSMSGAAGYLPKLMDADGVLLYDQPDVALQSASGAVIAQIDSIDHPEVEQFTVRLAMLFSDRDAEQLKNLTDVNELADWSRAAVIGGTVIGTPEFDSEASNPYTNASIAEGAGRVVQLTVGYGDVGASETGNYLDSYILSVPVKTNDAGTATAVLQARLSMHDPAYRSIPTVEAWNTFFSPDGRHAALYENVRITNNLDLSQSAKDNVLNQVVEAYHNVTVNRITGSNTGTDREQWTKLSGLDRQTTTSGLKTGRSLIYRAVTEASYLAFENITLKNNNAGSYKGVIARAEGDARHLLFRDCSVESTSTNDYTGMIGGEWQEAEDITVQGVSVTSGGNYTGGVIGVAWSGSTLTDLVIEGYTDAGSTFHSNTVNANARERVGGAVGYSSGIVSHIEVRDTTVKGRYLLGGAIGYPEGDGGRPGTYKAQYVFVGCHAQKQADGSWTAVIDSAADSKDPGNLRGGDDNFKPNVTVSTAHLNETTASYDTRYVGGAMGSGNSQRVRDVTVYNTLVDVPYKRSGDTIGVNGRGAWNDTYRVGGVVGSDAGNYVNCTAENCVVRCYGSYVGGISGTSPVGYYNTAKECVVMTLSPVSGVYVGGIAGSSGAVSRCTVQHCVVSGAGVVGGAVGEKSTFYENTVTDTVVLGLWSVGGAIGSSYNDQDSRNSVIASQDAAGNATVTTTLKEDMISPLFNFAEAEKSFTSYNGTQYTVKSRLNQTYQGAYVYGSNNVGGYCGSMSCQYTYYNRVGNHVTVEGNTGVGGVAGIMNGWQDQRWETTNRRFYVNCSAADVTGKEYVGGLIGHYTHGDDDAATNSSYCATYWWPSGDETYFGRCVFTGSVTGTDAGTTGFLIGRVRSLAEDDERASVRPAHTITNAFSKDATGAYMPSCRIWEDSTLNDVKAKDMKDADGITPLFTAYREIKTAATVTPENRRQTLTATAADLADYTFYFNATDNTYRGLGWGINSAGYENMGTMFTKTATQPADFDSYKQGIAQEGLVLWLDARNNTGKGYCDVNAVTWTDLAPGSNGSVGATLYWNNKAYGDSAGITVTERNNSMDWGRGGLEFYVDDYSYRAQLEKDFAPLLNGGQYTVEIAYSYTKPLENGNATWTSLLSWRQGSTSRGFVSRYENKDLTNKAHINNYISTPASDRNYQIDKQINPQSNADVTRTVTFVVDKERGEAICAATGQTNAIAAAFQNGTVRSYRTGTVIPYFPTFEDGCYGYVGRSESYTMSNVRISGVRIYDRPLTKEEIAKNSAYDDWYYFGRETSEESHATASSITWGDGNPHALFRSVDGNRNGELVMDGYTGDGSDLSRGYYYLRNGSNGSYSGYSDVKEVFGAVYLPVWRSLAIGTEYFDLARERYVNAQEGEGYQGGTPATHTGVLYDTQGDRYYGGGYRLPNVDEALNRNQYASGTVPRTLMGMRPRMLAAVALPETTAYASGVDRVNLELLSDPPAGLRYRVLLGDAEKLSGEWPEGSRTLTMTWDYDKSFTLELSLNGTTAEHTFRYSDLAHTVMTYGGGYWYLYGSECFDSDGASVDTEREFFHMMRGRLLSGDGTVCDAATGVAVGTVTPYEIVETSPLWSGTLSLDGQNVSVESYGTYLVSDGGVRSTQLIVKGDTAYTMPAGSVVVGSFVADHYGESVYTTVLGTDGILVDMGTPLVYPEEFGNANIRETSNTLGYDGNIVLVRYNSGMLVAFNYLNGAVEEVRSSEAEAPSLLEFVADTLGIGGTGGRSLLSGGASQALRAVSFQQEVSSNASLRTALANLTANEDNTTLTDGMGSGVYGETSGGLDGEPVNPGMDKDSGVKSLAITGQTATAGTPAEGGVIAEAGENPTANGKTAEAAGEAAEQSGKTAGTTVETAEQSEENAKTDGETAEQSEENAKTDGETAEQSAENAEAAGEAAEQPAETTEATTEAADKPAENAEATTEAADKPVENTEASGQTTEQPAETVADTAEPAEPAEKAGTSGEERTEPAETITVRSTQATQIETRYVSVYDAETGTGAVYDLKELLTQPEEELVTQDERAERLEELGFHTTLSTRLTPAEEQTSGVRLMVVLSASVAVLLGAMATIRRRRFDEPEK